MLRINFFETENGFDTRAIQGGVYQVELLMEGKESICLYIGESVWIASRCGKHLYSLFESPEYFGLTSDDLRNDELILKFSVVNDIHGKKSELGVGSYKSYKEQELEAIKKYEPLTQLNTSDRQIHDMQKKINIVQEKMIKNGFKEFK